MPGTLRVNTADVNSSFATPVGCVHLVTTPIATHWLDRFADKSARGRFLALARRPSGHDMRPSQVSTCASVT